jgi:hypothetical protein
MNDENRQSFKRLVLKSYVYILKYKRAILYKDDDYDDNYVDNYVFDDNDDDDG